MKGIKARDAVKDDLPALLAVRNTPHLFDGYFAHELSGARFVVLAEHGQVRGFARLKLPDRPAGAHRKRPLISDICVAPEHRSRGLGSAFIAHLEGMARSLGHKKLYVGVDPVDNPRAFELYKRRGYAPVQDGPFEAERLFHDADGNPPVKKKYWRVELVKHLDGR